MSDDNTSRRGDHQKLQREIRIWRAIAILLGGVAAGHAISPGDTDAAPSRSTSQTDRAAEPVRSVLPNAAAQRDRQIQILESIERTLQEMNEREEAELDA